MKFGIIAAGQGSRLEQEGLSLPKPLVKIKGVPMIKRLINIFETTKPQSISVVVNQNMPEVMEYLEKMKEDMEVPLYVESASTPSSMHTLQLLTRLIKPEGKFIVTTVDTIFNGEKFLDYVEAFEQLTPDSGMMAITSYVDDEKPLYVKCNKEMRIEGFYDSPVVGADYVSAGIYGLNKDCVKILDRCIQEGNSKMRNYQRALIENGIRLMGYDLGKVVDVDHISDIETAEKLIKEGRG